MIIRLKQKLFCPLLNKIAFTICFNLIHSKKKRHTSLNFIPKTVWRYISARLSPTWKKKDYTMLLKSIPSPILGYISLKNGPILKKLVSFINYIGFLIWCHLRLCANSSRLEMRKRKSVVKTKMTRKWHLCFYSMASHLFHANGIR